MSKDNTMPKYVMQIASKLAGMHPQTLRKYERAGLVTPSRINNLRLYSDADMQRLAEIKRLVDKGVSIAGLQIILSADDKVCDALNILFWKVTPVDSRGVEELADYWVAELADRNIHVRWDDEKEKFVRMVK